MEDLIKQLELLQKKSNKYDDLMKRSGEFASKLRSAMKLIQEVLGELDPAGSIMTRERSGINYEEIAAEYYEKMQAGLEVGADLISRTYPDWNYSKVQAIMHHIRRLPDVEERKEKKKLYLFCKKEWRIQKGAL